MLRQAMAASLNKPLNTTDPEMIYLHKEKRMPLGSGTSRLLTYVATMASEMWAAADRKEADVLHSLIGRLLVFLDQVSINAGRCDFAWLLTGLPEPEWDLLRSQQRQRLQPYSALRPPSWISTNLSYVRDVDFKETKLSTVFRAPVAPQNSTERPDPKGKAKSRRRNRYGKDKKEEEKEE